MDLGIEGVFGHFYGLWGRIMMENRMKKIGNQMTYQTETGLIPDMASRDYVQGSKTRRVSMKDLIRHRSFVVTGRGLWWIQRLGGTLA